MRVELTRRRIHSPLSHTDRHHQPKFNISVQNGRVKGKIWSGLVGIAPHADGGATVTLDSSGLLPQSAISDYNFREVLSRLFRKELFDD